MKNIGTISSPEPRNAEQVRAFLRGVAQCGIPPDVEVPTRGARGAVIGALNKYMRGSEDDRGDGNRRLALAWLFGQGGFDLSTKALTEAQWHALIVWVGAYKDEMTGKWEVEHRFPMEAARVVEAATNAYKELDGLVSDPLFDMPAAVSEAVKMGGRVTGVTVDQKRRVRF